MAASLLLLCALLIGDAVPPIALAPLGGGAATELRTVGHGKPAVIDFFATWCGPCRDSIPALERLRRRFPEVEFVSVSEDPDPAAVPEFVRAMKISGRVLLDPERRAFAALGAHKLPATYLLDGAGVVRKINHGYGRGYEARLAGWITELVRRR